MPEEEQDLVEVVRQNRLAQLLRKRKQLKEENGIVFYRPHPKQDMFHRAGNYRFRYVRAGNRFGKSALGAIEDISWALGERPWYGEDDPARTAGIPQKPTKGLVICNDWDKATEIFTSEAAGHGRGKMFQYLPKHALISKHKNHSGAIDQLVIQGKYGLSSIHFDTVKSFLQNPMSQESSNWDWIHVDEPIPRDMWIAVSRGLIDTGGHAWFACTPLDQPWINDFFIPGRNIKLEESKPLINGTKWMIVGSIYDNPTLTKADIEEYATSLTEDEKQCRLHGIPLASAGMVYKQFSWDKHVYREAPFGWETPFNPPANYTIRFAIDPHPRTPHAVLFAATAPTGEVFFFEEIFEQCVISTLCEKIKEVIAGRFVLPGICDPLGFIPSPIDERSMADDMADNGIHVVKSMKDPARGILAVQKELRHGKFYFHENLRETLYEFERYIWDPKRPNKPKDENDHMMENLYRMTLNGLHYVEPEDYNYNPGKFSYSSLDIAGTLDVPGYSEPKKRDPYARYTA